MPQENIHFPAMQAQQNQTTQGRFLPASQAHMLNQSLKVQDLIRLGNNKSGGSSASYNLDPTIAGNQDFIAR